MPLDGADVPANLRGPAAFFELKVLLFGVLDGLEELVDRFGKLPPQAQALFDTHKLRVLAKPYGVIKIDAAPGIVNVTFRPNPPIDPMRIIELVQKNKHIKLAGNDKLRIEKALSDPKDRAPRCGPS